MTNKASVGGEENGGFAGLDPEDDARDALATLRSYILADIPGDSVKRVEEWADFDSYVGDLCAQGLDTLAREPESLAVECGRLRTQLEEVSCSNYRALIESFECAGTVRDGVGKIRARLEQLIDALPPLASATREFSSNAADVQLEREARLRTLAEYGRVVEILEIPRLMRSLVSGELYEEALELRDFSLKLSSMHEGEEILDALSREVDCLTKQMILQLIGLLRGQVHLPACLRVVGFLRRLDVFSEPRLRMLFLRCRGEWMRSSLEAAIAPNSQAKLVHLSDDTRAMMFEIITQYRAAFAVDDEGSGEMGVGGVSFDQEQATQADAGRQHEFIGQEFVSSSAILSDWTAAHVGMFLAKLEEGLKDIREGASLATVMQQALYSGQSLGRVGADFRPALVPLFERAMMRIVNSHLNSALRQFEMMIEDHRWAPVGSSALRKSRMQQMKSPSKDDADVPSAVSPEQDGDASIKESQAPFEPPMTVLDSPALAVFLNGILAALNELRSCALLSLCDDVSRCVVDTLLLAAECMNAFGGPGGAFLQVSDRHHFASMHSSLIGLCVPHVARCVDHCMGQRGLVPLESTVEKMGKIFGDSVPLPQVASDASRSSVSGQAARKGLPSEPPQMIDNQSAGEVGTGNSSSETELVGVALVQESAPLSTSNSTVDDSVGPENSSKAEAASG